MINKSLVDELSEDKEKDEKIIKTFYAKDSLSEDIFQKAGITYKMYPEIRERLLDISDSFIEFLGVDFFVHDVILTGSLSNYNWSEFSDIDLHIIIDYEDTGHNITLLKEFFDAKKGVWNALHDIKIKNYEVEIYIQDVTEKHISSGVYSILNNKWIVEPQHEKKEIDDRKILEKGEEYAKIIDDLIEKKKNHDDIRSDVDEIKKKIKRFRQSGLDDGGEYSYENLTFKLLRRNGYIKKLIDLKKDVTDTALSINESHQPVEFSYRDALKIEKLALQFYGETGTFQRAGYITPSGYLLDFSEGTGSRVQDHRNIMFVVEESGIDIGRYEEDRQRHLQSWGMMVVMDMGFIRYMPETKGVDMHRMPTQEQFENLRFLIQKYNGNIIVEMSEDAYIQYEDGTPEDFIIDGIKSYYNDGIKPKAYAEADDDYI